MSTGRVCFEWRENRCKWGSKCRYVHQEDLLEPCRNYQRSQNCQWGNKCRFGHFIGGSSRRASQTFVPNEHVVISSTASSPSQAAATAPSNVPTTLESWRRICRLRAPFSPTQMKTFLEGALILITTKEVATVQEVIKELASEKNLVHIRHLLEADLAYDATTGTLNFITHAIPFLKIITNTEFQNSIVIEQYAGTIYNVVYGVSGTRGVGFFDRIISRSRTLISNNPEEFLEVFPLIVSAMRQTIHLNSGAMVQDGIKRIAKEALAQANEQNLLLNPEMRQLHQNFKVINEQLDLGANIPSLIPTKVGTGGPNSFLSSISGGKGASHPHLHPAIQATTRLPGNLSELGPRHDNDHASIADIRILPTAEEIRSIEAEYLPKFGAETNHLGRNQRLLDAQFRLLREDSIGPLRESLRQIIETRGNLETLRGTRRKPGDGVKRFRSAAGVAVLIHQNVRVEDIYFSDTQGLKIGISFDQPVPNLEGNARREWWANEDILSFSSLVCIINETNDAVFFTVVDRFVTPSEIKDRDKDDMGNPEALTLAGDGARAGIVLGFANVARESDIIWLAKLAYSADSSKIDLIEFPKTLLASFRPILQGLQSRINKTQTIPFIDWLAPDPSLDYQQSIEDNQKVDVRPPPYALHPGFFFDLKSIYTAPPDTVPPNTPVPFYPAGNNFEIQQLLDNTTLDDGQARSLVTALSREVGLIQGPPGTGKSFVGTKIVNILLANKKKANLGPVVCVCYTNHALDQFLEHLLDMGIENIVRLGSRSKSERLDSLLLKNVAKATESTPVERKEIWELRSEINSLSVDAAEYCKVLTNLGSEATLRSHILENYPAFYRPLFQGDVDEEGFKVQHGSGRKQPFTVWTRKAYPGIIQRPVRYILDSEVNPWSLTPAEINAVLTFWKSEIVQNAIEGLTEVTEKHRAKNEKLSTLRKERDRRVLQAADIIGVTTSGLAGHSDVLERIQAKVLFCEEAGEILEAHTITALIPSIEHMILIGDHEQLRPHVANYDLSTESKKGHALDVSLFERLVVQRYGNLGLNFPVASLNTQRRMHPTIADLIRLKTYPTLVDMVPDYRSVPGMKKRLFWMTHAHADSKGDAIKATTSYTNDFEQEMVISLVTHLLHQGAFKEKQIAVLTPYLGQMSKLRRRLGNTFEIVVGSRDQEALDEAEAFLDDEEEKKPKELEPQAVVRKSSLAAAVRIATIDNFQGEEAEVVIISLVRSNKENRCGFLKTSNRINVLLSRAKWGMYIIGDSNTAGSVPMWSNVISHMSINGCLGDALELQCPRHQDVPILVSSKEDFITKAPEGGCSLRCEWRLQCGHACVSKCHSDALHKLAGCYEPCPKQLQGCDHPCASKCGKPCAPCNYPIRGVSLTCGHTVTIMKCSQYQKLPDYYCRMRVQKIVPGCNHTVTVDCGLDINSLLFRCSAKCGASLTCGHTCKKQCRECRKPSIKTPGTFIVDHGECKEICKRPFNTCSHSCEKTCHDGEACGLCEKKCEIRCAHSKCDRNCRDPCQPCAEQCTLGCEHQRCIMPCGVSCNILPCDQLCPKLLECGHPCPSICGEKCPSKKFCRECGSDEVLDFVVDMLMFETYRESKNEPIIFLPCDHYFTVSTFDGVAKMKDFFQFDPAEEWKITSRYLQEKSSPEIPKCPKCRALNTTSSRYNEVVKKAQLQNSIRQFTLASHNRLVELRTRIDTFQNDLENSRDSFIPTDLKAIVKRYNTRELQKKILDYNNQVQKEEQPYHRVYELTLSACRKYNISAEEYNPSVVQYRFGIEGAYQDLRLILSRLCDMDIIAGRLSTSEEIKKKLWNMITYRIQSAIILSDDIVQASKERKYPLIEIQARIARAKFLTLRIKHRDEVKKEEDKLSAEDIADIKEAVIRDLEECLETCDRVPSCQNLRPEVEDTIRTVRGGVFYSTVTDKELKQIYAAMSREFSGSGHWYVCENGHQFAVGECGMPMRLGTCNECGARIGGQNHLSVEGVRPDPNFYTRMQNLRL